MILDFVLIFLHWKQEMYIEAAAKEKPKYLQSI